MPDSEFPQVTDNSEARRDIEREERRAERRHQKYVETLRFGAALAVPAIGLIADYATRR
ncbi:hypothetical protein [Kitasatospora sp. NPDC058478]|uniref:hypothetical protein n=1 Tax=unclassified Kitasatospora TaxID=2633591 RepID=UPI00365174F7